MNLKKLILIMIFFLSYQSFSEIIYEKSIIFDSMDNYSATIKIEKNVSNDIVYQTYLHLSPKENKKQIVTKIIYKKDNTIDLEGWSNGKINSKPQYRVLNIENEYNPVIIKKYNEDKWKEIYTLSILIANLIYENNNYQNLKINNINI